MRSRWDMDQPRPLPIWKRVPTGFIGFSILVGAVILAVVGIEIAYNASKSSADSCLVDSKDHTVEITSDSEGSTTSTDKWTVYTSCGVYQISDNLFFLRFGSAELYGSIKVGSVYDFDLVGWRNNVLGWYPTITGATEVPAT